jgi:hypothetical protein
MCHWWHGEHAVGMTTHFQPHHRLALAFVLPLLVALAADSVYRGVTGDPTFVTDDAVGPPVLAALVNLTLAGALGAIYLSLRAAAPSFVLVGKAARGARKVLLISTPALAVGFLLSGVFLIPLGIRSGAVYDAVGIVATVFLLTSFVAGVLIGLTQLRQNLLGLGGRLLTLIIPAALVTGVLAVVAPVLASPVFMFGTLMVGLATVGAGTRRNESKARARLVAADTP